MRVARRISSGPWDFGIGLAMVLMASLVLVVLGSLRATPLAAETSPGAPLSDQASALASDFSPQLGPALWPTAGPAGIPEDLRFYRGEEYRHVKTLTLRVTAYAPDRRCTWPYAGTTTASGFPVTTNGGHLVAADTNIIPMHALVIVPGYAGGNPVPVLDRGNAIRGNRLDVLLPTYDKAQSWGVRTLQVKVYVAR